MGRYAALLRGINVGGRNGLPMPQLVSLCEGLGCTEVSTYIQSGNVVLTATRAIARTLPEKLRASIAAATGMDVPVILRSGEQLAEVIARSPYEPELAHVVFLAGPVSAAAAAKLDPDRSPPDTFQVAGSEIYLRCPAGYGRSKLTNAYFDRALGTLSTVRNWRTVQKLAERTGPSKV